MYNMEHQSKCTKTDSDRSVQFEKYTSDTSTRFDLWRCDFHTTKTINAHCFSYSLFFKVAIKQADKLGRLRGTQKTATGAKKKFSTSDVVRGESVFLSVLNVVGASRLTLVSLGVLFLQQPMLHGNDRRPTERTCRKPHTRGNLLGNLPWGKMA